MSSNDKTGDKLVDSMRRTKANAAGKPAGSSSAPARKKRAASPKRRSGRSTADKGGSPRPDPYQSGRRVWPD